MQCANECWNNLKQSENTSRQADYCGFEEIAYSNFIGKDDSEVK